VDADIHSKEIWRKLWKFKMNDQRCMANLVLFFFLYLYNVNIKRGFYGANRVYPGSFDPITNDIWISFEED